jgi:hypothetical protein
LRDKTINRSNLRGMATAAALTVLVLALSKSVSSLDNGLGRLPCAFPVPATAALLLRAAASRIASSRRPNLL